VLRATAIHILGQQRSRCAALQLYRWTLSGKGARCTGTHLDQMSVLHTCSFAWTASDAAPNRMHALGIAIFFVHIPASILRPKYQRCYSARAALHADCLTVYMA
jgi:hypothetical protein